MLLEDEHGQLNLIIPSHVYEAHRAIVRAEPLLLARGRFERVGRNENVLVESVETLGPLARRVANEAEVHGSLPTRAPLRPPLAARAGRRGRIVPSSHGWGQSPPGPAGQPNVTAGGANRDQKRPYASMARGRRPARAMSGDCPRTWPLRPRAQRRSPRYGRGVVLFPLAVVWLIVVLVWVLAKQPQRRARGARLAALEPARAWPSRRRPTGHPLGTARDRLATLTQRFSISSANTGSRLPTARLKSRSYCSASSSSSVHLKWSRMSARSSVPVSTAST